MSLMVEGIVDGGMAVEKPLCGSRRLEGIVNLADPGRLFLVALGLSGAA
jgi:hypothetical protein